MIDNHNLLQEYKGYHYKFDYKSKSYKIFKGDWQSSIYSVSEKACKNIIDTIVRKENL